MKTLIIISISIILTLVVYSSVKQRKVVSCLSDCYYQCGSLFTVGMLLVAAMMTPVALSVNDGVVSFLMTASLAFIGVAADYQGSSDMERKVHVVSAYMACAAAVSGINPCLDSIEVYRQRVYETRTITHYTKPSRLSIGLQGGYGYGRNGFSPYIGIGISYNLINIK